MTTATVEPAIATPAAAPRVPARRWWRDTPAPVEMYVLVFAALVTRLTGITSPHQIVFDEAYFRGYALRYLDGTYYFDLHPPLGKLLLGAWAWLTGVTAAPGGTDPAVAMRVLPALAGSALVAVFYQLLRELSAGRKVAAFAAAMLVMENALLVESRLTLFDSLLLLFGISAVTCHLASWRAVGRVRWVLLVASALLAGMAASTKWTGCAALGLIGSVWIIRTVRVRVPWRRALPALVVLAAVPALVYVAVFAIHFALLPNAGPGDGFMSPSFRATLVGDPAYDPNAHLSFVARFLEVNRAIGTGERSLDGATDPFTSPWTSWPLMQHPLHIWTGPVAADGSQGNIEILGNPVVWWGVPLGAAVVAIAGIVRPRSFRRHRATLGLLVAAWAMNYLPFSLIARPMYPYHYFFALLYGLAAVSLGVGILAGWTSDGADPWRFPSRISAGVYWGLLAVALAAFLFFLPLSYGIPMSHADFSDRMWLSSWH